METKLLLDQLGGFSLAERGLVPMKGKGERLTFWVVGEDPVMREQRNRERKARRAGILTNDPLTSSSPTSLVPRSSLKNRSLVKTTYLRCTSESPKRLRFASSDQLDKKTRTTEKLESIIDGSPCKGLCSSGRSSCMEGTRYFTNLAG